MKPVLNVSASIRTAIYITLKPSQINQESPSNATYIELDVQRVAVRSSMVSRAEEAKKKSKKSTFCTSSCTGIPKKWVLSISQSLPPSNEGRRRGDWLCVAYLRDHYPVKQDVHRQPGRESDVSTVEAGIDDIPKKHGPVATQRSR
jgi:hypothetical protein